MALEQQTDYGARLDLAGRGFVVLGTGAGIGGEVCRALTQAGARVLCVDQALAAAQRAADEVGGIAMAADITRRPDMEAVFARAQSEWGDDFQGVVDVVGVPVPGKLAETDDATYDRQFDLVLRHAWLTISIAGPMLAKTGSGSLIFIGSLGGLRYHPGVALYCTAKAALTMLVQAAADEFGPSGVRVNVVAPGRIRDSGVSRPTEDQWARISSATPLKRPGEPKEVAGAVLFLASDLSSYVTGETLVVDGGVRGMIATPAS
ncbi:MULTISPECIES: SDR family NAD(P)-dependent oxidoreductase [unclassified Phenylobacterium]|uniref:SDR family NAD(P)-dependent oxidoreductase n=1 Tax=unclassified Phenylobacterium TaxID=2640670 RepID=UPI00083AC2EB|nr:MULTISPECIES: SDR family oxidoreductase [unclassified Phenylobacterium]